MSLWVSATPDHLLPVTKLISEGEMDRVLEANTAAAGCSRPRDLPAMTAV